MPPRRQALSLVALCASLAVASCASANQADSKITPWSFLKNLLSNAAPEKRDPVKMRLIGAGFGRTGTMSLKTALTELGYQTYHMKEGVIDGGDVPLWSRYALASPSDKAAASEAILSSMASAGYSATTDFPACIIYKDLMAAYPDAKVILSIRSSGEVWATSIMATIGTIGKFLALRPFSYFSFFREFSVVDRFLWETVGVDDPSSDHAGLAKGYNLWVAKVKAEVPADKLLVHDAREGWAPICAFLDLKEGEGCPSTPYPRVNEAAELERVVAFLEVVTTWWAWIAVGVYAALAMVAFGVWRLLASWMGGGGGGKVKGE